MQAKITSFWDWQQHFADEKKLSSSHHQTQVA